MDQKMEISKRFQFGKNWMDYAEKNFSQERVDASKKHILDFIAGKDLHGLSFLDIGCGSGLHSMAALQAGARVIHGFDYDPDSVAATRYIRTKAGDPANWTVGQGSVLDDSFMEGMPQYDLVYSWGVLHHTGEVWHAIRNAAGRVKPGGGVLYRALYSADIQIDPPRNSGWMSNGSTFRRAGSPGAAWIFWYILRFNLRWNILRIPAFLQDAYRYKKHRGMNILTDIRDWLGGWPMEFVYDADAVRYCEALGFRLERMVTGEANTEFLFVKEGTASR
jgi:2-polyprenyl-6-hydroxyphenyl methylase/3-demethylubiquinone-9 3-methyltransferase